MASYDAFDDKALDSNAPDTPFFAVDRSDKDALHKWLLAEMTHLKAANHDRFEKIKKNLARLKGIQYQTQDLKSEKRTDSTDRSKTPDKIVVNLMRSALKVKTSRLIKYRPGIQVLPVTDDHDDKLGAEVTKKWLDSIWYERKFDGEFHLKCVKGSKSAGEMLLAILWDKNIGPEHADMKHYKKEIWKNGKATLVQRDEQGNPVLGPDGQAMPELDDEGKPVEITRAVRMGDVNYKIWKALDTLVQRKTGASDWEDVEYLFHKEILYKQEVRKRYPKADESIIEGAANAKVYDYEKMQETELKNQIEVWTMYHKSTEFLAQGAQIVLTDRGIIESENLPYEDGELPCERLVDELNDNELHGVTFLDRVRGMAGVYNNMTNIFWRNMVMAGHPKWIYQAGTVKKEALGNDLTMVEFKGAIKPELATFPVIGQDQFNFRSSLKEEIFQESDLSGISRSEPPTGVKAFVAMQFLYELDQERMNEDVLVHNGFLKNVARKTIGRAAQFYDPNDKRQMQILGEGDAWMTQELNIEALKRNYDVRAQNSSALPEQKSARMQALLDMKEQFPDALSNEQFMDLIGFAQESKFRTLATVSVRAAEAENQLILRRKNLNDPKAYEDHIVHWQTHVRQLREWSFKNTTPSEDQKRLENHVLATEMLMSEAAQKNPAYLQELMTLSGFPIFYVAPQLPQVQNQETPPMDPAAEAIAAEEAAGLPPEAAVTDSVTPMDAPPSLDAQATEAALASANPVAPSAQV